MIYTFSLFQRFMFIALALASILWGDNAMAFFSSSDAAPTHQILSSNDNWLNTSRPLQSEDFEGRIVLLDFWTFCCINCIHVQPDLKKLEEEFGDKLTVVGVHSAKFTNEQDSNNIRDAIVRYGIKHPVVNDADFGIWRSFHVRAWPSFSLLGPKGQVLQSYSGEGNYEAMRQDIQRLIERYDDALQTKPLPIALEEDKSPPTYLSYPGKIVFGEYNNKKVMFISDSGHHRIVISDLNGIEQAIIGTGEIGFDDGDAARASFNSPQGMAVDTNYLYVADTGNHALRRIDLKTLNVTTLAGNGSRGRRYQVDNTPAYNTALASPWDLAFYPDANHLAIAMAGTHQLWTYNISDKTLTTLAGNGREYIDDGPLPYNSLSQPSGLSVLGEKLYFVDSETSALRVLEDGILTTLVGTGLFDFGYQDGPAKRALLQHSLGLQAVEDGIYIADAYNHALRFYAFNDKTVSTVIGPKNPSFTSEIILEEPNDITLGPDGQFYMTDTNAHRVLRFNPTKQTSEILDIMPKAEPIVYTPKEFLPYQTIDKNITVKKSAPVTLHIALPKGYKINDEAPSYLAIFNSQHEGSSSIQQFEANALKQKLNLSLPGFKETQFIQGTIYYCEDKPNALCLIKSFELKITPTPDSAADDIDLVL